MGRNDRNAAVRESLGRMLYAAKQKTAISRSNSSPLRWRIFYAFRLDAAPITFRDVRQ